MSVHLKATRFSVLSEIQKFIVIYVLKNWQGLIQQQVGGCSKKKTDSIVKTLIIYVYQDWQRS
jgi:hypothetical protein